MIEDMRTPIIIANGTKYAGPSYANADYEVTFDNLNDEWGYGDPAIDDGIGKWTQVRKAAGTAAGTVKLTFTMAPTYEDITTGNSVALVRSTDSGTPTPIWLEVIK